MIYMDNAASAPVDPDVFRAAQPFFMEQYGNPSSVHSMGRKAREAVEKARKQCAVALGCEPENIFFTSGGTESDNWAIQMHHEYLSQSVCTFTQILYNKIEHKAVLNCLDDDDLDYGVNVETNGVLDFSKVKFILESNGKYSMKQDFTVVCMAANNELGTVQPIKSLSDLCYKHKVPFHCDAVQYIGKEPLDLKELKGITSLAISGHKIGGFKGSGLLYIRNPKADYVQPLIYGGGQEKGLRSGTENVPGIVALGAAMEKITHSDFDNTHVKEMHEYLQCALSQIPAVHFNGDCEYQLPYYLNISFKGILGEALALALDRHGICVSTGSACNTGSLTPSHVLTAIGLDSDYIDGTIRISLSESNTLEECKTVAETIKEEVAKLRNVSPVWKGERVV